MNGDDGKQMINELKQYIDDGMLISFLQMKSIDHPKVLKFVSFKNNILRLLMINDYCGIEDFGHVLNVHYQRYLNEEILPILNNIFTFVKKNWLLLHLTRTMITWFSSKDSLLTIHTQQKHHSRSFPFPI